MILAATKHGVYDLDNGDIDLPGRDVSFVTRHGDELRANVSEPEVASVRSLVVV